MRSAIILCCLFAAVYANERSVCACTYEYRPVCGSDGVTYANPCMLRCAQKDISGLTMAYEGECAATLKETSVPVCTLEYRPICGSNGITYPNPCTMRYAQKHISGLTVAYEGECAATLKETSVPVCTLEYRPICGSNGITYPNPCTMRYAQKHISGLTVAYEGECAATLKETSVPVCTLEYRPICGSNGITYPNPCTMRYAQKHISGLTVAYEGECAAKLKEEHVCVCTYEYMPVCGSDGTTYPNLCSLKCAQSGNSELKMVYEGVCGNELIMLTPICPCTREFRPVCGTNGKTFANPCLLKCEAKQDSSLSIAHYGECETAQFQSCICTMEYSPVCGTDGRTYSNPCLLRCAQKDNKSLRMAYHNACQKSIFADTVKPCFCTDDYTPVCGTDGKTYANLCGLKCSQADHPSLQMSYKGECGDVNANGSDPCVCTREYWPVCGTDNKTYSNKCMLNCAASKKSGLQVQYQGTC